MARLGLRPVLYIQIIMNVKFKLCTIFIYKKNIHLENINSVPENINNYL